MLVQMVRHELELAVRTRRVLLVSVLYVAAALVGGVGISTAAARAESALVESMSEQTGVDPEALRRELAEHADDAMAEVFEQLGVEPETLAGPLRSSVVAPVFYWCSLAFLPFMILLSIFDTISTDLRGRTLCYTTLRAPRWAAVVSKALAWWVLIGLITAGTAFAVMAVAWRSVGTLSLSSAMASAAWISVVLLPFSAVWIAATLWCSATTDKPMTALVRAVLLLILLRLLTLPNTIAGDPSDDTPLTSALRALRYLSPKAWYRGLWHGLDSSMAMSCLAMCCFAVVFTAASVRWLDRRDL